jgi:hypothetical protein
MPISPEQARRQQTEDLDDDYKYYVKRIDSALRSGGRTFSCVEMPGLIVDRVIREYRSLGWNVRQVGDSRDGDFLQFSEDTGGR